MGSTGACGGFQSTAGRPLAEVAEPRMRVAGATLAAQGELAAAMDKAQATDDVQAQTTTSCAAAVYAKERQPRLRLARPPSRTALKGLVKLQERSRRQQLRRRAPRRSSLVAAGAELTHDGWGGAKLARTLVTVAEDAPALLRFLERHRFGRGDAATRKRRKKRKVWVVDKWAPL